MNTYITLEDGSHHVVDEGDDVTELLGITKYEPPIPVHMSGEVFNAHNKTISYDIENIQKYPDVLESGETVEITEKIHGTWVCFGFHPEVGEIVTSKGLSAKGLAFKFNGKNALNVYMRALHKTCSEGTPQAQFDNNIIDQVIDQIRHGNQNIPIEQDEPFYMIGEVFGKGVQDLSYGLNDIDFRLIDVYVGFPERGRYLNVAERNQFAEEMGIACVPVLYHGPLSQDVIEQYTDGTESVSGKNFNIREGVVIKPVEERYDPELGRVVLKSVSEQYLLRKGKTTEYN